MFVKYEFGNGSFGLSAWAPLCTGRPPICIVNIRTPPLVRCVDFILVVIGNRGFRIQCRHIGACSPTEICALESRWAPDSTSLYLLSAFSRPVSIA